MAKYHEKTSRVDRTFKGKAPTGENVKDDTGPNATPGIDVGASELPTHGDLGFPGSPNVSPNDPDQGPEDVGAQEPDEQISDDSPR